MNIAASSNKLSEPPEKRRGHPKKDYEIEAEEEKRRSEERRRKDIEEGEMFSWLEEEMRRRGGGQLSNNNWAEPENLHEATFLPFLCLPLSIHQPDQPQRFHRPPPYWCNISLFCVRVPNCRLIYWSLFFL